MPLERARIDFLQSFVLAMRSVAFLLFDKGNRMLVSLGISYQVRICRVKQGVMKKGVFDETIL